MCEDFACSWNPAAWEKIPVITDLCLRVQRCTVQATGGAMVTLTLQEWVYLTCRAGNGTTFWMSIVHEAFWGSALASLQK